MVKDNLGEINLVELLELVNKQQETSQSLIEDILEELKKIRAQNEDIIVIRNRLNVLEKNVYDFENKRTDCIKRFEEIIKELTERLNKKTDDLNGLDKNISKEIVTSEKELKAYVDTSHDKLMAALEKLKLTLENTKSSFDTFKTSIMKDVYKSSGKYGAMIAFVVTLLLMLIQALFHHLSTSK